MPDGLIVVYVVRLTSGAGRLLHSELVAVHARATSKGLPRRAADARREAADALRRDGARMRQVVEHLMSARLDEIAAAQREAAGRMAARERALVERYASASRQLLQAGLFDTRALNDRQRRLRSRFNSAADSDRRIGELADSPRKRLLEPVAVLHAGRPTHRR